MLNFNDKETILGKAYQEMGDININISEVGLQGDIEDLENYENFLVESE